MVRGLRFLVVMAMGALAFQSCTCHRQEPEPEPAVSQRSGFSAALPTRRRDVQRDLEPLRAARATAVPPTLPEAFETPTPGPVDLPDDFPTDVPLFEGAEAFAVQPMASDGRTVLFRIDAEAKEIFGFYRENMPTQGWSMSQEYQTKDQSFLSFKKGNMITNVTIAKDPRSDRQIIALMYYEEQELPFPEF
jgi:hypothetical protein